MAHSSILLEKLQCLMLEKVDLTLRVSNLTARLATNARMQTEVRNELSELVARGDAPAIAELEGRSPDAVEAEEAGDDAAASAPAVPDGEVAELEGRSPDDVEAEEAGDDAAASAPAVPEGGEAEQEEDDAEGRSHDDVEAEEAGSAPAVPEGEEAEQEEEEQGEEEDAEGRSHDDVDAQEAGGKAAANNDADDIFGECDLRQPAERSAAGHRRKPRRRGGVRRRRSDERDQGPPRSRPHLSPCHRHHSPKPGPLASAPSYVVGEYTLQQPTRSSIELDGLYMASPAGDPSDSINVTRENTNYDEMVQVRVRQLCGNHVVIEVVSDPCLVERRPWMDLAVIVSGPASDALRAVPPELLLSDAESPMVHGPLPRLSRLHGIRRFRPPLRPPTPSALAWSPPMPTWRGRLRPVPLEPIPAKAMPSRRCHDAHEAGDVPVRPPQLPQVLRHAWW